MRAALAHPLSRELGLTQSRAARSGEASAAPRLNEVLRAGKLAAANSTRICVGSGILSAPIMSLRGLGTLLLLCALLLWLVRSPRREVRSQSLSLLRAVFPAWRFFEEIADVPALSHRLIGPDAAPGPWVNTLQAPVRTLGMLFLNAAGNLYLAQQSLVEQLAAQLEDEPERDPTQSTSYRLVQALVIQRIRADQSVGEGQYQFQLCERGQSSPSFSSQLHTL